MRERCFSSPVCPGSIVTQGKESRVGSAPRTVCVVHIGSLAQAPCAARARVCGPGGPPCPWSPTDSAVWVDTAQCWDALDESPGESRWGKEFPDPSLVPLLSPALPVAAAGASLQRGGAWPGAQRGIGLGVTVGYQQTWWVQEPWRRMRWDPQAWVGRPPGTAPPSCYLSPCWGNEDQATEACIPAPLSCSAAWLRCGRLSMIWPGA